MKTSSKALSWSGVCFSLWAIARFPPEVKSRTSTPTKTPSSVRTYRVLFIALLPAWACAPPEEGDEQDSIRAHRSEEHTSELQSRLHLVCRLLLEKKKKVIQTTL